MLKSLLIIVSVISMFGAANANEESPIVAEGDGYELRLDELDKFLETVFESQVSDLKVKPESIFGFFNKDPEGKIVSFNMNFEGVQYSVVCDYFSIIPRANDITIGGCDSIPSAVIWTQEGALSAYTKVRSLDKKIIK